MIVRRFVSDLLQSNMFLAVENGHALVIDPCRFTRPAEGLTVDRILLTHEHYDHISGVNAWKQATGAPVLCSAACAERLGDTRKTICRYFDILVKLQTRYVAAEKFTVDHKYTCTADETFVDRMTFEWQGHTFELFEIPGHSAGSIGILADREIFFSGDSLIEDCAVELRLPGSSKNDWILKGQYRLAEVPTPVTVYPGHMAPFVWDGSIPFMELWKDDKPEVTPVRKPIVRKKKIEEDPARSGEEGPVQNGGEDPHHNIKV